MASIYVSDNLQATGFAAGQKFSIDSYSLTAPNA